MDAFTEDDASYFTTESLGETQEMTPEGFLLCRAVPIARVGTQLYGAGEIPVEPDRNGIIRIVRDEAEVFRPETIASFNGKPVADDHPPGGKITPDNFKKYTVGTVMNPRRGDGRRYDSNFMYADLLVKDQLAIHSIRTGKREVSSGYDAEYVQDAPGQGRQRNIVGNHVALVHKGRCGALCSIGDSAMANRVQLFRNRIARAVRTRDEAGVLNAVAELSKDPDLLGEVISGDEDPMMGGGDGPGHHHVTINVHGSGATSGGGGTDAIEPGAESPAVATDPAAGADPAGGGDPLQQIMEQLQAISARQDQMEQVLAMLADDGEGGDMGEEGAEEPEPAAEAAPPEEEYTGDRRTADHAMPRRATVGDSASLRDSWQRMLSQAEILVPGISLPTMDSAAPAKRTFSDMCAFRRDVLDASMRTADGAETIRTLMEGNAPRTFNDNSMTCDAVGMVYNAAANILAQRRGRATHINHAPNGFTTARAPSAADINKRNRERYGQPV